MTQDLTEQQVADRFRNRRKMAWRSFWLIVSVGCLLIGLSISSDTMANRIDAASWIITLVLGVWASIVLTYFGAASLSDWRKT